MRRTSVVPRSPTQVNAVQGFEAVGKAASAASGPSSWYYWNTTLPSADGGVIGELRSVLVH